LGGYPPTDDVDLEAERLDQPAQRADPGRVGRVQPQLVQQRLTAGAEQVADRHRRSLFGQHRVHLRLQPGPQRDQLGVSPPLRPESAVGPLWTGRRRTGNGRRAGGGADGRFVSFLSGASNPVPGDRDGLPDLSFGILGRTSEDHEHT